jgi:hypothetical protein
VKSLSNIPQASQHCVNIIIQNLGSIFERGLYYPFFILKSFYMLATEDFIVNRSGAFTYTEICVRRVLGGGQ